MRILYVIPGSPAGSDQIFSRRQARALTGAGLQVFCLFVPVWSSPARFLSVGSRLHRNIQKIQPDIVHAQYGTMTGIVSAFASPRKFLVTFRGSDLNPASNKSTVRNRLGLLFSQIAALRADAIVCVSKQLKKRLWWNKSKVEVIPSAVDLELFRPMPVAMARSSLGWAANKEFVLFNGGRSPATKGLRLVESAVQLAEKRTGPIDLVVLNGKTPPDQMPLYYNASDCLILASLYEGSPNVVKEAMACNLPVVSTDVGDVRERLVGVHPSRIAARDPESLAKALADVMLSRERSNGRERVASLSLESTTERLIAIYRSLLSAPHGRR